MIIKSFKDNDFEIVVQQSDSNLKYSVSLLKNDRPAEFQGNLDMETAMEIFDFYFDKAKENDLSDWGIK
jgi:hypothetical protein